MIRESYNNQIVFVCIIQYVCIWSLLTIFRERRFARPTQNVLPPCRMRWPEIRRWGSWWRRIGYVSVLVAAWKKYMYISRYGRSRTLMQKLCVSIWKKMMTHKLHQSPPLFKLHWEKSYAFFIWQQIKHLIAQRSLWCPRPRDLHYSECLGGKTTFNHGT